MLESLDKLDTWIKRHDPSMRGHGLQALEGIRDAIQAEVDERYISLPVAADGLPIRVDDVLEYDYGDGNCGRNTVEALIYTDRWDFEFLGECGDTRNVYSMSDFFECNIHVKPRTVEDVLRDVWKEALDYAKNDIWRNPDEVFAERADELRELMGGAE